MFGDYGEVGVEKNGEASIEGNRGVVMSSDMRVLVRKGQF